MRAGQEQQLVDQYYFEGVLLTGLLTSAAGGGRHRAQPELDYAAFNRGHVTQDIKGVGGDIAEDDRTSDREVPPTAWGRSIAGDAIKAKLERGFARCEPGVLRQLEGSGGWLARLLQRGA